MAPLPTDYIARLQLSPEDLRWLGIEAQRRGLGVDALIMGLISGARKSQPAH